MFVIERVAAHHQLRTQRFIPIIAGVVQRRSAVFIEPGADFFLGLFSDHACTVT
jgi:hypothetical protein